MNELTADDVDAIREALAEGATANELAVHYGVTAGHIRRIRTGRRRYDETALNHFTPPAPGPARVEVDAHTANNEEAKAGERRGF